MVFLLHGAVRKPSVFVCKEEQTLLLSWVVPCSMRRRKGPSPAAAQALAPQPRPCLCRGCGLPPRPARRAERPTRRSLL